MKCFAETLYCILRVALYAPEVSYLVEYCQGGGVLKGEGRGREGGEGGGGGGKVEERKRIILSRAAYSTCCRVH